MQTLTNTYLPEKIRVSVGSAILMGLQKGKIDVKPTTAYLLLSRKGKCVANCSFCPQAKYSNSRANMLSRVTWPTFSTDEVIEKLEEKLKAGQIKRICLQSLNYLEVFNDLLLVVKKIRSKLNVPISVSCKPLNKQEMKQLQQAGVNRICISVDAATEKIFKKAKGSGTRGLYDWKKHHETLTEAVKVFGKNFVTTHLIAGLGETEEELCQKIQWCVDSGIYPALFAFTPIMGTAFEKKHRPQISRYRRIQVAHFLSTKGKTDIETMKFDCEGKITGFGVENVDLIKMIETGNPFMTSGCPECNRPYYNENPRGPFYNYPRSLTLKEAKKEKKVLGF